MAAELGPKGVTGNMMAPGYFLTEINTTILGPAGLREGRVQPHPAWPLGRPGKRPAGAVALSGCQRLPAMWNGQVLVVEGGLTETFVLPVDAA